MSNLLPFRRSTFVCLIVLVSCKGGVEEITKPPVPPVVVVPPSSPTSPDPTTPTPTPTPTPVNWAESRYAENWEIGPIIDGENYSKGMPLRPSVHPEGVSFNFPQPSASIGHVNYVTIRLGPLNGKKLLRMRYRIEADATTNFYPKCCSEGDSSVVLYFQRRGDDWNQDGWRWWSVFAIHKPLGAGEFEMVAPLEPSTTSNWKSVLKMKSLENPNEYKMAVDNADRVGFTFGGGGGQGHGVYATAPAKFVLKEFAVE